jgi:hypothetical protein
MMMLDAATPWAVIAICLGTGKKGAWMITSAIRREHAPPSICWF